MSKNILVIEEFRTGEFECQGEKEKSFVVIDVDALNAMSKKYILDNNLPQKWREQYNDESIEPLEGGDWSFRDLYEDILCCDDYDNIENMYRDFEQELYWLDLSKEEDIKTFGQLIKDHICDMANVSRVSNIFCKNQMLRFFSKEEVESVIITNKIQYKTSTVLDIEVDGLMLNHKQEDSETQKLSLFA